MKRLLLLIFLAGPLLSPAQEPDNTPMRYDFHAASEYTQQSDSLLITTHQGRRLFFDTDGNSYIPRKAFIEKYGRETFGNSSTLRTSESAQSGKRRSVWNWSGPKN